MALLLLLLLIVVPVTAFRWARLNVKSYRYSVLGLAWGLIAGPFSLGLYSAGFAIPLVGIPFGQAGLWSVLIHGEPGYAIALALGLIERGMIVDARGFVVTSIIDGLLWAPTYGAAGLIVDHVAAYIKRARIRHP